MVEMTGVAAHRHGAEQEGFSPGPRVLVQVLAHLWSRSSAWARVLGLGALVGLAAKAAALA